MNGAEGCCVACGRAFSGNSKPTWAFSRDGRLLGRVHTSPCVGGRNRRMVTVGRNMPLERARFYFWLIYVRERQVVGTDAWYADLLADDDASEVLSPEQERRLDWWQRRVEDPLSSERIDAIRELHTAMIREFRAWMAATAPAPNGCS